MKVPRDAVDDKRLNVPGHLDQSALLREALEQNEQVGASRRALLLHTDRLPPSLAKPHHLRLARESIDSLTRAQRAQLFELSRGRWAIIWRSAGGHELKPVMEALGELLAGQPDGQVPSLDELVSLYELPEQTVWLLDELGEDKADAQLSSNRKLDVADLVGLEAVLARSELSQFARWRKVVRLTAQERHAASVTQIDIELAWEERYFAVDTITASLYPDRSIKAQPWLFQRLTRTLDRCMLAMLSLPLALRATTTIAINLNVATILAADFLRFDDNLPVTLRGKVILNLRPVDILADADAFVFARNFVRSRGYRLALSGATLPMLQILDARAGGFHYAQVNLSDEIRAAPDMLKTLAPVGVELVLTGLHRASDVRWAVAHGVGLGRGRALV